MRFFLLGLSLRTFLVFYKVKQTPPLKRNQNSLEVDFTIN